MPKYDDITGQQFGYLIALEREIRTSKSGKSKYAAWKCLCTFEGCNEITYSTLHSLRSGQHTKCGKHKIIHGLRHTRIYGIWNGMKIRCYDKNNHNYKKYGAKGITVCDEWKNSFIVFNDWAQANGYTDDLTLDRIDPLGNYEPNNCRWVSQKIQQNNRSNNVFLFYDNKFYTISELADKYNIDYALLRDRIMDKDWTIEDAINIPKGADKRYIEFNGETHTLVDWERITGIGRQTIANRIDKLGWSVEKALTLSPEIYKNRKKEKHNV